MNIELKDKNGITLKTAGKYCSSDVGVIPKLQSKSVATNGSVVADEGYCGLDSVTVAVPATPTQEKTVDLAMASGNQIISPDAGKNLSKVTVTKPSTLVAGNIKTGVSIGGVTGTLEVKKDEEAKTVDLAMASGNQTITPTSGKVLSQVVVKKPATMLPENIKKDVNIGGVTGTLEIGGGGELNIYYGDTAPTDTSKLWVKTTEPESVEISPELFGEELQNNKLYLVCNAVMNNKVKIVNSNSAKITIGITSAFKGDENNKAKEVTAYVHDGVNWHTLAGEITLTKLYAPKISISEKTLTITNDERNGSYVTNYKVYTGSTLLTTITATTLDLTTVITVYGTYNISVIATGTGYTDSDSSNVVEYIYVAPQLPTPINLTVDGTIISWDAVENAESYDVYADDTALLGNTTGIMSYTITSTLTNVTAASGNATTIATGET